MLNVEGDYSEDEGKEQEQGNISSDDWDDEEGNEESSSRFDQDLEGSLVVKIFFDRTTIKKD